jgi:predicted dehydrogenase
MLACVRTGQEAETSGRDNLRTYAVCEAAYEAARNGRAVKPAL